MQKRLKWEALRVFGLAALVAAAALLPAIAPYGGRFITRGDYLEQQIAFLLESRSGMLAGGGYSPATFLGAGLIGAYSFYTLGSIFVWPLLFLPDALMLYGVSVMAVVKHAVAALTAYLYLRKMRIVHAGAAVGALMYAFSSFTLINEQFYHFTDVIALFPLIPLALEDAAGEKRRFGALALACAINALTNYYFFVSTAIFTALYFAVRFFSADWKQARSVRWAVSVVFECACGSALAGILLVPSAIAALSFTRASGADALNWARLYKPSDFLERLRALLAPIESGVEHAFYADAARWASVAGFLPVFGAAAWLPMKQRRSMGALALILLAASLYPAANAIFSGGTSVLYARWWYALDLVLAFRAAQALTEADGRALRRVGMAALGLLALLTAAFLLPEPLLPDAIASFVKARDGGGLQRPLQAFSLGLLALHYGLYFIWSALKDRRLRTATAFVCLAAALHFASFLAVNDALLPAGGVSGEGETALTTGQLANRVLQCVRTRKTDDSYTYRVDSDGTVRNFGLLRNEPSISAFHSLRSGYVSPFVQAAGFGYDETPTAMPGDWNGGIRTFLSVKRFYAFEKDTPVPEGFVPCGQEDGFFVYENENYLPMGFFYPSYSVRGEQALDTARLADTLLSAVVLEKEAAARYAGRLPHETQMLAWEEAAQARRRSACSAFEMTRRGFSARIDAPQAGFVFFSVPYDKGFTAYVDGVKASVERANLSFMAVWVEKGTHSIEFVYRTRGVRLGAGMSALSALALGVYAAGMRRKKKRGGTGWI